MRRMKKTKPEIVTPFDWRRYTAPAAEAKRAEAPRKPVASKAKKLTVKERVERIMAQRWGNPYCKPGAA